MTTLNAGKVPTKHEIELAIAETWHKWGGWAAVESGMINMTGVLADRMLELFAAAAALTPKDPEQ